MKFYRFNNFFYLRNALQVKADDKNYIKELNKTPYIFMHITLI